MKRLALISAVLGLSTAMGETSVVLDSSLKEFHLKAGATETSTYAPIAGVQRTTATEVRLEGRALDGRNLEVGDVASAGAPDYYLGDTLKVPANVDWVKTYETYLKSPNKSSFLFDGLTDSPAVYVAIGGEQTFTWVVSDGKGGTVNKTLTFRVGSMPRGRPRRIFWTNGENKGPVIDLSARYVGFFGDANILTVTTNSQGVVTRGLYYSVNDSKLHAYNDSTKPDLVGQVLMVYYDTSKKERIVHVQVVQVCSPDVKKLKATVGSPLSPNGDGYPTEGLLAEPSTHSINTPNDGKLGPYLYQHKGEHSWSPKNNTVFAIRPTTGSQDRTAFATIWWKEADEMNVLWPFVQCGYDISWPEQPYIFVRNEIAGGDTASMYLPSSTAATVMEYQDPPGLAGDPVNGAFTTKGEVRTLLKLTGNDNVWFLPIESVNNVSNRYFTMQVEDWNVGSELRPRIGSASGLGSGQAYRVDDSLPGYVAQTYSDSSIWAKRYYKAWSSCKTPQTEDGANSAIFPVNANGNTIEVWWMRSVYLDGLSEPVIMPVLPQVYRPRWPDGDELPSIVFASQKGSANDCVWNQTGALVFDGTNAAVKLSSLSYFSSNDGTLMFWMRRTGAGAKTDLLSVEGLSLTAEGDKLNVKSGNATQTYDLACSNSWRHVAVSLSNNFFVVTIDGKPQEKTMAADAAAKSVSRFARLGATVGGVSSPGWEIGELKVFATTLSADAINLERYRVLIGNEQSLLAYWSFRDGELALNDIGIRTVLERCFGMVCETESMRLRLPGPPAIGSVIFASESGASVYAQNDKSLPGFNPNEEHATISAGSGGLVAWAARNDLNDQYGFSKPVVLVRYLEGTRQLMQALSVKMTDEWYPKLAGTAQIGSPLPGPHPFDYYVNPWNDQSTWESVTPADDGFPCIFRDRKNVLWPRAAGKARMSMKYRMQEGFYQKDTFVGDIVDWANNKWDWSVEWPTNGFKTMKIGCTLTKSMDGLPEVWSASSMAVVYPVKKDGIDENLVKLWDPTVRRQIISGLSDTWYEKYGMSYGDSGDVSMRDGRQYLNGVPPSLVDRIYVEPSTHVMYLDGKMDDDGVLFPNLVTKADKESLKKIKPDNSNWASLVETFPTSATVPNKTSVSDGKTVTTTYSPVDHYAMTTLGHTGWVVLVENDGPKDMVNEGSAISMQLIKVIPEYYCAKVIPVQDANDKLSQKVTLMYTESFAGRSEDFLFSWACATPTTSGRIPVPGKDFQPYLEQQGLVRFTIGEQGSTLKDLVDRYFTVRFSAVSGTPAYSTMSSQWSDWVKDPALAEGWLKRCLNNVTPFTQRMDDLTKNKAETAVSMIRQAGAPYEGDVALNQANLNSVGLIQLYTTLLNKGEKLSLGMKTNDDAANKQLLLAAERLGELYGLLGDEAWADALNPTIGFGSNFGEVEAGLTIDYGAVSSKLFCFDNQVASLLDEELALLRGRSGTDAPSTETSPCYNRLIWNFTRGIKAGEVAYAVNYDITGIKSTTLGYEQAREMYPQGHGDAYGHYLSALTTWYRLLRNPYFSWPVPAKDAMNVGTTVVNVRYENEAKFATAAANLAKTAARVVDLTARAAWRDNGVAGSGLCDASTGNAFGYGEWASRGGYGGLVNWVVGNSLLPGDRTVVTNLAYESDYVDFGIERIDRGTTDELEEICSAVKSIQATLDRMDAGINPLGMSTNAVPFDLSPIGASDGTKTHYEQIADRAQVALDNAQKVLDAAQESSNRLRLISEAESGLDETMEKVENDYDAELVAIFGRPYDDDIGPGKTYSQNYNGPDLYHYMWMDLEPYGFTADDTATVATYKAAYVDETDPTKGLIFIGIYDGVLKSGEVKYSFSRNGLIVKDSSIRGTRKANGTIQLAYADYLSAYAQLKHATTTYEKKREQAKNTFAVIKKRLAVANSDRGELVRLIGNVEGAENEVNNASAKRDSINALTSTISSVLSRFVIAESGDLIGLAIGMAIAAAATDAANCITLCNNIRTVNSKQKILLEAQADLSEYQTKVDANSKAYELWELAVSTTSDLNDALEALLNARTAAVTAAQKISEQVEAGAQSLSARTLARKRIVNNVAKLRYNDMFFRLTRNEALSRYEASFDIAQKYMFLAAKAYGYDSGLLDASSGAEFLRSIASERSLGALQETKEKLDANWLALKGRLGINNPQPYATWFSLRQELCRVLPSSEGDHAWRSVLEQSYVPDLSAVPEFKRLCQPFVASGASSVRKEPGFVFEFPTCIDFSKNFFGKSLSEGDHAFDSTYLATKVAAAGVWFEGYSTKALGSNPVCYLVPAGEDRMRVPGAAYNSHASWTVLDQVVPLPYAIGTAELDDSTWYPTFDGETAGADDLARIRLFPSFRAYYGEKGISPNDDALNSARLVGRSVWNTKWMLIIPAGSMYADREKACDRFISTVSDIKLGLKTYSNSGN